MVSMAEPDHDDLRFQIKKDSSEIYALWFSHIIFGVSSSPFLLDATIQYHLEEHNIIILATRTEDFFLDPLMWTISSVELETNKMPISYMQTL